MIAQFQPRMNEVISEESANKMIYMLKSVVDGGTASRLRFKYNLKGDIGGKTGTTNNNSDAWFMGILPTLVNACWVGGDDRDIHFNSMAMGQGASDIDVDAPADESTTATYSYVLGFNYYITKSPYVDFTYTANEK